MSDICPISISEIIEKNFYVPSYQRGYRWTRRQVRDLLNDIKDFMDNGSKGIYCIQPLVVQESEKGWNVIDGQQRLTTINIILACFSKERKRYTITYETREKSQDFLENICTKTLEEAKGNADFYHMFEAYKEVKEWADVNKNILEDFSKVLLNQVKFIWYVPEDENPITIFTRLNIDKIALTPAELIKALFLNRTNFGLTSDYDLVRLRQQEIASQWDTIENKLQDDEFWLFFHDNYEDTPTRIDYFFELICDRRTLGEPSEDIGHDGSRIFRYFNDYFHHNGYNSKTLDVVWGEVLKMYNTILEWYSNLKLYHYIGYLMSRPNESTRQKGDQEKQQKLLNTYLKKWEEDGMTVNAFETYLKGEIQNAINCCNNIDQDYEISGHPKKTASRPILLLHNIQTVIDQGLIIEKDYRQQTFNRFPFNLYKIERWDVEHIDSNTENDLEGFEDQRAWLITSYIVANDTQKEQIKAFLKTHNKNTDSSKRLEEFNAIRYSILPKDIKDLLLNEDENEKNRLWNFTLLDEATNRGYKNAIFPSKRRIIIGKEQGKFYPCPTYTEKNGIEDPTPESSKSAFIVPCTKQAFMKYYSPTSSILTAWTKKDAIAYRNNIIEVLGNTFTLKYHKDE